MLRQFDSVNRRKCVFMALCILISSQITSMKNIIEVHIAAPKLDEKSTQLVRETLNGLGLPKTKHFQKVNDVNPITPGCLNGHDLQNPGTMSTVKVFSIEDAVNLVRTGMSKLRELGIEGTNFEIERVMVPEDDTVHDFSLEATLPDFKDVPNSPRFENHLVYKGTTAELPSDEEIVALVRSVTGQEVNQIVDFTKESEVDASTVISRVATIYQPSQSAAATMDSTLQNSRKNLGNPRIVTEQVLTVGEFK